MLYLIFVWLFFSTELPAFATSDTSAPAIEKPLKFVKHKNYYETLPAAPKGGTLYFNIGNDPKVMNPLLAEDNISGSLEGYMWMSLFDLDLETLDYIPALATNYEVSPDKKSTTFTLNKLARWQDGTPVSSADVKFTFDTLMDPKTNAASKRSYYEGLSLKVLDESHFVFRVDEAKFDTLFQLIGFPIIQKKQFEHSDNFNKDPGIMHPIGNAAYKLEKYDRGQEIVFVRNKKWWARNLPQYKNRFNVDKIVLRIISDQNLAYEKFVNGDLDALGFSADQWHNKVMDADKDKFGTAAGGDKKIWAMENSNQSPKPYSYIGWNLKNPLFQSVKTRTALSHLVNYKKIIEKVFYNLAIQTTSPFGSLTLNSAPELRQDGAMIGYDPDKAMELLKEDGFDDDGSGTLSKTVDGKKIPFEFTLDTNSNEPARLKIAQIIKEDFKEAGIKVTIKTSEWNSFLDKINKRNFDALLLGWTAVLFPNAKQVWDSSAEKDQGSNFISYSNPQVDALIKQSNTEFDAKKRNLLMQQINRLIYADQPYTFLVEMSKILEGLNSKIASPRWTFPYSDGAENDLFYLSNP